MTVVGLDDTDSRTRGMCTTYLAARVAGAIEDRGGTVDRLLLVRLNPAVEHKTRGNAALAIHTDLDADGAFDLARRELAPLAEVEDPRTSPGLVVADAEPRAVPTAVADFARDAVRDFHRLDDALSLADEEGFRHEGWAGATAGAGASAEAGTGAGREDAGDPPVVGRGRIGALAAVGAFAAFDDWTYEHIAYREFDRCGTPREVDVDSVFAAAEAGYPDAWDTVDRVEGQAVCVPNAPGPILYGIRGDDPQPVREVAADIASEPVERSALFLTNQGTDAHLRAGVIGELQAGRAYRVDGVVADGPETREGGHVFLTLADGEGASGVVGEGASGVVGEGASGVVGEGASGVVEEGASGIDDDHTRLDCVAFEPTRRFRDRVRALRPGDEVTACGEVSKGTLKLEKFAVRDLVGSETANPTCPDCGRSMESAGREQGYRCRECGTTASGLATVHLDRDLEEGWYEVPPCARRHIAKPLVRGGFDAPVHPER